MWLIKRLPERNAKMRRISKIKLLMFQTVILLMVTPNYLSHLEAGDPIYTQILKPLSWKSVAILFPQMLTSSYTFSRVTVVGYS